MSTQAGRGRGPPQSPPLPSVSGTSLYPSACLLGPPGLRMSMLSLRPLCCSLPSGSRRARGPRHRGRLASSAAGARPEGQVLLSPRSLPRVPTHSPHKSSQAGGGLAEREEAGRESLPGGTMCHLRERERESGGRTGAGWGVGGTGGEARRERRRGWKGRRGRAEPLVSCLHAHRRLTRPDHLAVIDALPWCVHTSLHTHSTCIHTHTVCAHTGPMHTIYTHLYCLLTPPVTHCPRKRCLCTRTPSAHVR